MRKHARPVGRQLPILITIDLVLEIRMRRELAMRRDSDEILPGRPVEAHGTHVQFHRVSLILVLVGNEVLAQWRPGQEVDAHGMGDGFLGFGRDEPRGNVAEGVWMGIEAPLYNQRDVPMPMSA